jgi:hypothetical protein
VRQRKSVCVRGHDSSDGEEAGTRLRISKQFRRGCSAKFAQPRSATPPARRMCRPVASVSACGLRRARCGIPLLRNPRTLRRSAAPRPRRAARGCARRGPCGPRRCLAAAGSSPSRGPPRSGSGAARASRRSPNTLSGPPCRDPSPGAAASALGRAQVPRGGGHPRGPPGSPGCYLRGRRHSTGA